MYRRQEVWLLFRQSSRQVRSGREPYGGLGYFVAVMSAAHGS